MTNFPTSGVTLASIQSFIDASGGRSNFQNKTTKSVFDSFIKPKTKDSNSSYVHTTDANGTVASVFIIHSWQHLFLDFVDALSEAFKGEESTVFLWIDVFCCNLHSSNDKEISQWNEHFKPLLSSMRTILILSQSNQFATLKETSCIYELYSCIESGTSFQVELSPTEIINLENAFMNNFDETFRVLSDIKIENSSMTGATTPEKNVILNTLKAIAPDFQTVDEAVMEHLRGWLVHYFETAAELGRTKTPPPINSNGLKLAQAKFFFAMGHTNEAEPMLLECYNTFKAKLGPSDPLTVESMEKLANLYYFIIKYPQAEKLFKELIKHKQNQYGLESDQVLDILLKLGTMQINLTEHDRAEPYFNEIIKIYKKANNRNKTEIQYVTAVNSLATIYYTQGRLEDAEPMYMESLKLMRTNKDLGPRHPTTLTCINQLGNVYSTLTQFDEAGVLFKELYDSNIAVYGANDEKTLESMYYLALNHKNLNDYTTAEQLLSICVTKRTSILGAEDPDTLLAVDLLCVVYEKMGEKHKTGPLYLQAINARKATLGASHVDTVKAMNSYATFLFKQEKFIKAEPFYMEVLEHRKATLGEAHPDTIKAMNNLGIDYQKQSKFKEAVPLFKKVYEYKRVKLGESHPETVQILNVINAASMRIV